MLLLEQITATVFHSGGSNNLEVVFRHNYIREAFSIDDIITEAFERLGFFDYSGNDLKTTRRSLNIMF